MSLLFFDAQLVRATFEQAGYDIGRATDLYLAEVQRRAEMGDPAADSQLLLWTRKGARDGLKSRYAALNQVEVGTNGQRTVVPRYFSVRGDDGSRQLRAWEFKDRAAFEQIVREYEAQTLTRQNTLTALRRVLSAWDEHPECATAAEAAALAGIALTSLLDAPEPVL